MLLSVTLILLTLLRKVFHFAHLKISLIKYNILSNGLVIILKEHLLRHLHKFQASLKIVHLSWNSLKSNIDKIQQHLE